MAYKYGLTKKLREILPAHYVKRCVEFDNAPPVPVHWKPAPGKYRLNPKTGEKLRVVDDPIKAVYPAEANHGLWGGEGLVQGLIKPKLRGPRRPQLWRPLLTKRPLYSEILDRWMLFTVTHRTLNHIDEAYGFDNYILKTPEWELNSRLGMEMKREMLVALVNKTLYPDDANKQEKVYQKYKQFIIPIEEAEWLGLSVGEAVQKARGIQAANTHIRPYKEIFAESFVEELRADEESTDGSSGWLSRINPFSKSEDDKQDKSS